MDKTFEKFFVMEVEKRVENKMRDIENKIKEDLENKIKKEEAEATAKEMLTDGEPVSKIKKYTKLTDEEINRLQEELAC